MKVSYNVLKKYLPDLWSPQEIAELLTMHTAEVEEIHESNEHLTSVFIVEVLEVRKHPDSEKLNICKIVHNDTELQIICGAPNVRAWLITPLATIGTDLWGGFVIAKSKIRGETSEGMLCGADEIWLSTEKQNGIMELPADAPIWMSMKDYVWGSDSIIEVDNKAINHRPDLFSHIGIAREIAAITNKKLDFSYIEDNFSNTPWDLKIENNIPDFVKRYIGVQVNNVENMDSPEYIKEIINTEWVESKWLLVDITNYSLYLYGQPTHCFDADTINGNIVVRMAKSWETFHALNDKEYELSVEDIVIADQKWVIALGWIIGGSHSAVSNSTKNIIVEWAHFEQSVVRQTGKRHGLRTDALNVFEKDLQPKMAEHWVSLIIDEIQKLLPKSEVVGMSDIYRKKQEDVSVDFDLSFINTLIGKEYKEDNALSILTNLGIKEKWNLLSIPFWRKDLHRKADIAEEIARIDGFDNIKAEVISINSWAILQHPIYNIKKDSRIFWIQKGFYDMYNYSFVWEDIMKKLSTSTENLIPLKNSLSEDATHMKNSHIPNLLKTLEKNSKSFKDLKLFELEKVYTKDDSWISEKNMVSGVVTSSSDIPYYEIQTLVNEYLENIGVVKSSYMPLAQTLSYVHAGRTAHLIVRGRPVGLVWEIHPMVAANFKIQQKIAFFELDLDLLTQAANALVKAKEISEFQMNHFDICFSIDKDTNGILIQNTIEKTDPKIIKKVELFDIYQNEEKLPGKRSISFKVYIQSLEWTLDDEVKNTLIKQIIEKVEKKWGILR